MRGVEGKNERERYAGVQWKQAETTRLSPLKGQKYDNDTSEYFVVTNWAKVLYLLSVL